MSIWTYNNNVKDIEAIKSAMRLTTCVYCNTLLTEHIRRQDMCGVYIPDAIRVRYCPLCGWWTTRHVESYSAKTFLYRTINGATGSLLELDLSDQSIPIAEIRNYLCAKYETRFCLNAYKFEDIVATVYKDIGYFAKVTARSGDGGIDVILENIDGVITGVQIKRYRGKIKVEQIRSLAGALILEGLTRGIFVTTSSFQAGAQKIVDRYNLRGLPIELIDANRFYDALGLAQRKKYETADDPTAPFFEVPLIKLGKDNCSYDNDNSSY